MDGYSLVFGSLLVHGSTRQVMVQRGWSGLPSEPSVRQALAAEQVRQELGRQYGDPAALWVSLTVRDVGPQDDIDFDFADLYAKR